jgi:oligopeptide transport system substrate-binding protein
MNTNAKRVVAGGLSLAMVLSLAACGSSNQSGGNTTSETGSGSQTDANATYTYNTTDSAPSSWSPTDWQTSNEDTVQMYTQSYFYDFILNDAKDGYDIVPLMAADYPVDVTSELTAEQKATYGLPEDATEGYAWKIDLNQDAQWEDGTPINADTYVYTMQQFLNPEMKNYRASSFYEGTGALANAKAYYNGAGTMYNNACDTVGYGVALADAGEVYINTGESCYWWGDSMDNAYASYGADYFTLEDGTDFFDKYEADTDILVTDEVYADIQYLNSVVFGDSEDNWIEWCFTLEEVGETSWDQVGMIKNDDYSLTFVLCNPTTTFFVEYNMQIGLVYEDLYESCKVQTGDIVKSSYGTTAESYMSYGPYTISSYQADKEMRLTRNDNWFGYDLDYNQGKYQTTDIYIQYISENATILSLFLQGNLDTYGVDTDHMETYQNSDYIYYAPESYTWCFTFNTDETMLAQENTDGVNHSILSLDSFREAIGLSLDRQSFVTQCLAGSDAGYGLINYAYVCDPDTGELYRDSEYAQQTLCNVYGVDDVSEITGYDKDAAAALFQEAYDEALASGMITENDRIELDYHIYADTTAHQNRVNFLQSSIDAATVGTSLEGKVTINAVVDEEYYDNCKTGLVDIAFTAWGGGTMDPYGTIQCYADPDMQLVYGYDPTVQTMTITVDGQEITDTAYNWYVALCMGDYANADADVRNSILAQMEEQVLEYHGMAVLAYLCEGLMYSQRVVLGSDTYVNSLVGFGGIRDMSYTMNDEEWAAYCAEQNNQLTY